MLDRDAELKRTAMEHERELAAVKLTEQERLKKEIEAREEAMRQQLESALFKLQDEKLSIETKIRGVL